MNPERKLSDTSRVRLIAQSRGSSRETHAFSLQSQAKRRGRDDANVFALVSYAALKRRGGGGGGSSGAGGSVRGLLAGISHGRLGGKAEKLGTEGSLR